MNQEVTQFAWKDACWLAHRAKQMQDIGTGSISVPLNIYEVHLETFLSGGNDALSLPQYGDKLAPYVKHMGYTHVELLSSVDAMDLLLDKKMGSPFEFCGLVDTLHRLGVGVMIRFYIPWGIVPDSGAAAFLVDKMEQWIEGYHIDGFHVELSPATPKNHPPIQTALRDVNIKIRTAHPDVLLIAEMTEDAHLSLEQGGLGYHLVWNRSWRKSLSDYLSYVGQNRNLQHKLLSEAVNAHAGKPVILPLSRSFVSRGSKSILDKAEGNYQEKIDQFKTALMLHMTRQGKKLMFMGNEFGQTTEWDEHKAIDWSLLDMSSHRAVREYVAAFNRFYLSAPALWELDDDQRGFRWIYPFEANLNLVAYKRYAKNGGELWVILSFHQKPLSLHLPAKEHTLYEYAFETANNGTPKMPLLPKSKEKELPFTQRNRKHTNIPQESREWYIDVELPPMSGLILRPVGDSHKFTH